MATVKEQFTDLFVYSMGTYCLSQCGKYGAERTGSANKTDSTFKEVLDRSGKERLCMAHLSQIINIDLSHHFRLNLFPSWSSSLCSKKLFHKFYSW